MKILHCINENEIFKACFQFEYKGYTISTSNLFNKYETTIFKGDFFQRVDSIPQALKLIDSF